MRINVDFSELERLADRFNKTKTGFVLKKTGYEPEPIDFELKDGRDVSIEDIDTSTGLLSYKDRQVLLYIKDHSRRYDAALDNGSKGNKFHIAYCRTLQDMESRNRFNRYVATNNISGEFIISAPGRADANANLWVCQFCLGHINYKGSSEDSKKRYQNARDFELKEFFSTYSSCFKKMPRYTDKDSTNYTSDWSDISEATRKAKNYCCENCHVNLSAPTHRSLCHAHHVNGVKSDNSPSNLQVLCADCHRKAHDGHMHVRQEQMDMIQRLRHKQGLLDVDSWDEVYKLIDPALRGELYSFRKNGYPVPKLDYEVLDTSGKILAKLNIAWPVQKKALSIDKQPIPGWEIYNFGQLFGMLDQR